MKHGQISRNSAKAFFAFAALALAGACADNTAAPTAEAPAFVAPANFLKVGNSVVFRVNNSEGITKRIGSHLINIPAGAICDLATSGYGPSMWDADCQPLRGSVVITATLLQDAEGQPYVDFQPAMRFAPNKEVTLFMRSRGTTRAQTSVMYCNNAGFCHDESLTDASLKPFRVGKSAVIGRRIKHFSGYYVSTDGRECQEAGGTLVTLSTGEMWCEGGDSMMRRSGYMVASGEDVSDAMKDKKDESRKEDSQ
jgi:hypothetical protein